MVIPQLQHRFRAGKYLCYEAQVEYFREGWLSTTDLLGGASYHHVTYPALLEKFFSFTSALIRSKAVKFKDAQITERLLCSKYA